MTFRGHVSNGVVLLPNSVLPDGALVEVTPLNNQVGVSSGPAILAALEKLPKVPREWVDELDQTIAPESRSPTL